MPLVLSHLLPVFRRPQRHLGQCVGRHYARKKPSMIFSSACSSVRPRVRSLMICSPAIFPMAASWIKTASILPAYNSGEAFTVPWSARIGHTQNARCSGSFPLCGNDTSAGSCLLPQSGRSDQRRSLLRPWRQ